jgi:hypothetical protein
MFHLFKKTYVEIDSFINLNLNRIVISEVTGVATLEMLDKVFIGTAHAFGQNYDSVIGEGKKFSSFLDMMQFCHQQNVEADQKIIIYCDPAAYIKIISMWYKTIFVNITAESAYRICSAHFSKEILIPHRSVRGQQDHYREFLPAFESFELIFNSATVDNSESYTFVNSLENSRSVEYLLASYFYNQSHKNELKYRVWNMINRNVDSYFREVWKTIQFNALRSTFQERIGTQSYSLSNVLDIINDPVLEPLKRTNSWKALNTPIKIPLDLSSFTDEDIEQIKLLAYRAYDRANTDPTITPHPEFIRTNMYIDIVRNPEISDFDLEQILNLEVSPVDYHKFFASEDQENINLFFIDWILETVINGDIELLQPYLIK